MLTFKQLFKWNGDEKGEPRFVSTDPQRTIAGFRNPAGIEEGNLSDFLTNEIKRACRRLAVAERLRESAERRLAVAMAHREAIQYGYVSEDEYQCDAAESTDGYADEMEETQVSAGRVVIYSEEPILASGLESIIDNDPSLQLAGYCSTIEELKDQFVSQCPDVAVLDMNPRITSAILFELQKLAVGCRIILWTSAIEAEFALRALTIGIRGILSKSLPVDAYRECLQRVNAGALWFENVCQADCANQRLSVQRAG